MAHLTNSPKSMLAAMMTVALTTVLVQSPLAEGRTAVFSAEQENKVLSFANNLLQCRGVVGATVAVVRSNHTWTRGFGLADREAGVNVTSSTLFGIGSISKAFTTTLISLFINETGKYTWKTPLKEVLGGDFKLEDDYRTDHLTIEDTLLHRTGLMATNIPLFAGSPEGLTRAEFVKRLKYFPNTQPFRGRFTYNNWMYGLAGSLAEAMGGGAVYEDQLELLLYRPLGMMGTKMLGKNVGPYDEGVAKPYVQQGDEVVLSDEKLYTIRPMEAAGAIASSADDMAKWLQMLLNKGQTLAGVVVLNEKRLKEMLTPGIHTSSQFTGLSFNMWMPTFPITYETNGYGYAWMVGSYRGYKAKYHSGGLHGYVSWLVLMPDFDFGIFVSTNGPGSRNASYFFRELFFYIADLVILEDTESTEEPWLNQTNSCEFPDPWQPPKEDNSTKAEPDFGKAFQDTDRYIGSYGHLVFGNVHITSNGTGNLTATYNLMHGQLYRVNTTNATSHDEEPIVDYDGRVTLFPPTGILEFLSRPEPDTVLYLNFTFADPQKNQFQEVHVSFPMGGETEVLIFKRGLKFESPPPEPKPESSGADSVRRSASASSWLLVACAQLALGLLSSVLVWGPLWSGVR